MSRRDAEIRKTSPAQALVEFALVLSLLLLIMYGMIETGRLVFIYSSVVSAAREAASYGSAAGPLTAPYYNDCAGIRNAARKFAILQPFTDANIQITYDNGPTKTWTQATCPLPAPPAAHPANGDRITVTVSTVYTPIVPLVPFTGHTITSSSSRTFLVSIQQ